MLFSTLLFLSLGSIAAAAPTALGARDVDKKYIFATFSVQDETRPNERTQLNIYSSGDGINFDEYAMNAYSPASPGLIRDPSIIKYQGKYYVTYTTGWYGSKIGIISSDDLKSWAEVTTIDVASNGLNVGAAWAPEFFIDPNGGGVSIILSVQAKPDCHQWRDTQICGPTPQFKPFILSANGGDLKSWGAPKEIPLLTNHDPHIDMFVVYKEDEKNDKPYHAFIKNEKAKHIEHWKAAHIEGPYEWIGLPLAKGVKMEAPAITRSQDGKWILYSDNYHGTFFYSESTDLYNWDAVKELPNISHKVRHGTVLEQ